MAFVQLDDRSGRIEVAIFADTYNEYREKLVKDGMLIIDGQVSYDDFSGGLKMRADAVRSLNDARQEMARGLRLHVSSEKLPNDFARHLADILEPYRQGNCPVTVHYSRSDAAGELTLGDTWKVKPEDELLLELRNAYGRDKVSLQY
jgi:DNA polymerase-3 subunit alpha